MTRLVFVAVLTACLGLAGQATSYQAIDEGGQPLQISADPAPAFPVLSGTIYFSNRNGPNLIDFETGESCASRTPCSASGIGAPYDLSFGSGGRAVAVSHRHLCSTEEPLEQAAVALLDGRPFESVTDEAIATAPLVSARWSPAIGLGDTLIVYTCEGNYFKVGNVICNVLATAGTYTRCENANVPFGAATFAYQRLR